MSDTTAQVRITNTITNDSGTLVLAVLSIKASALLNYVSSIRDECNRVYTPNESKKHDHLPLLSVYDFADTMEELLFEEDALPKETVVNSKGVPMLIILPEEAERDMGVNRFESLEEETLEKIKDHIKENSGKPMTVRSVHTKSKK